MSSVSEKTATDIREFIIHQAESKPIEPVEAKSDPFWQGLHSTGTELWLDTGDIEAAGKLWNSSFTTLTTNNALLNAEIHKGIYDNLIMEANRLLADLDIQSRIIEIAFILNAFHGMRLVQRFDARVSVELHTETAHDIDAMLWYARRFHAVCPASFIIKIPLTPAGLIAARQIRQEGIAVNVTLGFSARQNFIATAFAKPDFVNVFLGRINAYIADNKLGDGTMAGEKATLASQKAVAEVSAGHTSATRQIAASVRTARQIADLAGVDVITMPVQTAEDAHAQLSGTWENQRDRRYNITLAEGISAESVRLEKLWDISGKERALVKSLEYQVPYSAYELAERCYSLEIEDLFPRITADELWVISGQGKIPKHATWDSKIERGELAIDSLLSLAALESLTVDQRALDRLIEKLISNK